MSVAVIRRACLMEDEGLETFINSFASEEEAQKWIDSQVGEYFKPQDYRIAKSVNFGICGKGTRG